MHNHSYEKEFNLHVNEISFSYEKMGAKTRFEEEAKGNSEMAYWLNNSLNNRLDCKDSRSCMICSSRVYHVIGPRSHGCPINFAIRA